MELDKRLFGRLTGLRQGMTASLAGLAFSNVLLRLLTVTLTFLSFRIISLRFGSSILGLWTTIVTFQTLLMLTEGGIAFSYQNAITKVISLDRRADVPRYTASALAFTTCIAMLGLILVLIARRLEIFSLLLNSTDGHLSTTAQEVFGVCLLVFFLQQPLSVWQRYLQANLRIWEINCATGLITLLSFAALATTSFLNCTFFVTVVSYFAVSLVLHACMFAWTFGYSPWKHRLRLRDASWECMVELLKPGIAFWLLPVTSSISLGIDNIMISRLGSLSEAASYALGQRLFNALTIPIGSIVQPLWPLAGSLLHTKNYGKLRQYLVKGTLAVAGILAVAITLTVGLGRPVIGVLFSVEEPPSTWLLFCIGLGSSAVLVGQVPYTILMAVNKLRPLIYSALVLTILASILKPISLTLYGMGGMALIGGICYAITTAVPAFYLVGELIRRGNIAASRPSLAVRGNSAPTT